MNKTVDIAYSVEHSDYYDLYIQMNDNFTFRFIIDKANVGKKINLREPDPLTKIRDNSLEIPLLKKGGTLRFR